MLGKIFGVFCLIAFAVGVCGGNAQEIGNAVLDGAAGAVKVTLSLAGVMCFWSGIMEVLREVGAIRLLAKLLRPLLRLFFPHAAATGEGAEEVCANIAANLLGLGNAATPFALSAMKKLGQGREGEQPLAASGEQITLAVLNCAPFTLIPANLLALRRAAGSAEPYAVLIPVWICSATCALLSLTLSSVCARVFDR